MSAAQESIPTPARMALHPVLVGVVAQLAKLADVGRSVRKARLAEGPGAHEVLHSPSAIASAAATRCSAHERSELAAVDDGILGG